MERARDKRLKSPPHSPGGKGGSGGSPSHLAPEMIYIICVRVCMCVRVMFLTHVVFGEKKNELQTAYGAVVKTEKMHVKCR